jgi:hypothetical protein
MVKIKRVALMVRIKRVALKVKTQIKIQVIANL